MAKKRPIMFVGTGSDVGKSIICSGICRILKQDGFHPAPFKGQNMSNNSYATSEGKEIGRAQAVQAEAAGLAPHTDMNPILLKPNSNRTTQLILNGEPSGNESAFSYFNQTNREELFEVVMQAFNRLSERYNPIIAEGAGSVSELNLRERDVTNMRVAVTTNAATYLIADIDRGGIFGSVYGTLELMTPEEKKQIKGIIINKFRGDIRLFDDGIKILEKITQIPVVGVIPYFRDIYVEEEDAVALINKSSSSKKEVINIAVVLLSRMSNFTDFNTLERDSRVHLFYTDQADEIEKSEIVILPGTKSTIADLLEIRKKGLVKAVVQAYDNGKKVIGICGGYQMLGEVINDPDKVEGNYSSIPGIGLLPIQTTMAKEKKTSQRTFKYRDYPDDFKGYEIHMGITTTNQPSPLLHHDNKEEGYLLNNNCWGTYMHGILDNQLIINDLLEDVSIEEQQSYVEFKEENYNKLANHLREHLNIGRIYKDITLS